MKDTPYIWQPVTDFFFHIDEEKKRGFERRVLITVVILGAISILHAWVTMAN